MDLQKLMNDYDFQKQQCNKCKKISYCIKHEDLMVWLCQNCFTWAIGYADLKDRINKIYKELGMENIENGIDIQTQTLQS